MNGVIKNYRRGRRTVNERQLVVEPQGSDTRARAFALVGAKVTWTNSVGKPFSGKITAAHGGNGAVRVQFSKGMPGQCIGEKVEITPKNKASAKPKAAKPKAGNKPETKAKPVEPPAKPKKK